MQMSSAGDANGAEKCKTLQEHGAKYVMLGQLPWWIPLVLYFGAGGTGIARSFFIPPPLEFAFVKHDPVTSDPEPHASRNVSDFKTNST